MYAHRRCKPTVMVCEQCREPETDDLPLVPIGTDMIGHRWMHAECWEPWFKARKSLND